MLERGGSTFDGGAKSVADGGAHQGATKSVCITRYEPDEHLEIKVVINEGHVTYRHHLIRLTSKSTRLRTSVELVPNEPVARPDLYAARLVAAVSANLATLMSRFENTTSARLTSRSRTT